MRYGTIVADPPWPYKGNGVVGNGGRGKHKLKEEPIVQVGVKNHYSTMTVDQICNLRVKKHAALSCHLYLWTTNAFMQEAFQVAHAWGFKQKTILTWIKTKVGSHEPSMKTGFYYRGATEHCLFCVRGPTVRLAGPPLPTFFRSIRYPHSIKPHCFYKMVREQSPGPYLELFSRYKRKHWHVWGDEVESDVILLGKPRKW